MFDIGFSEIVLIALLALIVLGPKRLPEVARAAGGWAGRVRRFVDSVKRDLDRDMQDEGLSAIRDAHRTIKEAQAELSRSASDAVYDIIEKPSRASAETASGDKVGDESREVPRIAAEAHDPHAQRPKQ